jgi:formamidopyrimidine-DNA glycosylase
MPELPEVETVRRMLESAVRGRTIASVGLSGLRLREAVDPALPRRLRGRTVERIERRGKYLLVVLDRDLVLLSHLGMTGGWLVVPPGRAAQPGPHTHVQIRFRDGTRLWFEDPRRFGLLRLLPAREVDDDPSLSRLGPDPITSPPTGATLGQAAGRSRTALKVFLMDQKRIAGIGNIYASEVLHRSRLDPRRRAGTLRPAEWGRVADEIRQVLGEAIERMGTTFSDYRTPDGASGAYSKMLRVYARDGEPCRTCGGPIRRIVQAQRSTYFCPRCQAGRAPGNPAAGPARSHGAAAPRGAQTGGGGRAERRLPVSRSKTTPRKPRSRASKPSSATARARGKSGRGI